MRDDLGIQIFNEMGNFLHDLSNRTMGMCYGLATDGVDTLFTVVTNPRGAFRDAGFPRGETHVLEIDLETMGVKNRIQIDQAIKDKKR